MFTVVSLSKSNACKKVTGNWMFYFPEDGITAIILLLNFENERDWLIFLNIGKGKVTEREQSVKTKSIFDLGEVGYESWINVNHEAKSGSDQRTPGKERETV